MGQKTIVDKVAVTKDDYQQLTVLAKEGITSRSEIHQLDYLRTILSLCLDPGAIAEAIWPAERERLALPGR